MDRIVLKYTRCVICRAFDVEGEKLVVIDRKQ